MVVVHDEAEMTRCKTMLQDIMARRMEGDDFDGLEGDESMLFDYFEQTFKKILIKFTTDWGQIGPKFGLSRTDISVLNQPVLNGVKILMKGFKDKLYYCGEAWEGDEM